VDKVTSAFPVESNFPTIRKVTRNSFYPIHLEYCTVILGRQHFVTPTKQMIGGLPKFFLGASL
jgi:hypothetical protein